MSRRCTAGFVMIAASSATTPCATKFDSGYVTTNLRSTGTKELKSGCGMRERANKPAYPSNSFPVSHQALPHSSPRRPGHQREGTLFGHLRIGNTFAPVGKFDGSHLHGIGDPESGQFQLPHILPVEETGKIGIGPLGSRDSTDRRQAHTVIQSIRFPPILHRIGHHAVPLPAKTPQQGSHPRRIIHWFSGFWEPEGLSYGRTGKRAAPARPAPARQR